MARIGILTCSNCTQELDCASAVCLADMRKRSGFFERYQNDDDLVLVGIINCAGCPTLGAPQKILRKVNSLVAFRIDAIHFSYCLTALCPFKKKYADAITAMYPGIEIVQGTHLPRDPTQFQDEVREVLCAPRKGMTSIIQSRKATATYSGEPSTEN
jgi:predicted metal-binding protein